MTAALEGGEWSASHPGHTLPQEKTWYPLHRRLGGLQDRSVLTELPGGVKNSLQHISHFLWNSKVYGVWSTCH